jgi:hypothetical protein
LERPTEIADLIADFLKSEESDEPMIAGHDDRCAAVPVRRAGSRLASRPRGISPWRR